VVSNLFPVVAIDKTGDPQVSTDLVEVDPDRASALATVSGDVRLLDKDRVWRAPPFRGLGGCFLVLGFWGSFPARVGCQGFCRGFCRGFERRELEKCLILTALCPGNPGQDRTLLGRNCRIVTAVFVGRRGLLLRVR